jgi:hypothetical protein
MPADYYRNDFSGAIHRRGCKHASARHGKPQKAWDGWSVTDLIDDAEAGSRLEFLILSPCCFTVDEIVVVYQRRADSKVPQLRRGH